MRSSRRHARRRRHTTLQSRKTTKKGGYTAYFPTKQSEILFAEDFLGSMTRRVLTHQEKMVKANQFFKSVMHFTVLPRTDRLFVSTFISKFNAFANETDVPSDFHANRLQALDYLRQFV
jgi:hypothetical protein